MMWCDGKKWERERERKQAIYLYLYIHLIRARQQNKKQPKISKFDDVFDFDFLVNFSCSYYRCLFKNYYYVNVFITAESKLYYISWECVILRFSFQSLFLCFSLSLSRNSSPKKCSRVVVHANYSLLVLWRKYEI